MAIIVDPISSPRIITVPAPATAITIQELVDQIRDWEDDIENLEYDAIASAGGKESLGGGVFVGITLTLLNAKLAFETRPGPTFVQCNITGGNLVALDEFGVPELSPIQTTAYTQITLTSSSSATLQEAADIQYASYNNRVTIDAIRGTAGTAYPIGTLRVPCNNIPDARVIALERGFSTFFIVGNYTFDTGDDISYFKIIGSNVIRSMLTILPAATTDGVEIVESAVTGTLDGGTLLRDCYIEDLEYVNGYLFRCELAGAITLGGIVTAHILDCFASTDHPTIDLNGGVQDLNMQNFSGDITLINRTNTNKVEIYLTTGQVTLDASVVEGANLHIAGVGEFTNNSAIVPQSLHMLTPDSIWENNIDGTVSAEQTLRLIASILGGKVSGAGTGIEKFRDLADTKDRVTSTVDANGNRTNVVKDLT